MIVTRVMDMDILLLLKKNIDKPETIIKQSGTKRKIDPSDDPKDVDLTYKKTKKVRDAFK